MKIKLMIAFILVCVQIKAQDSEFKLYDNGLIYSETSMGKLKRIVDSLNLKFKVCDVNKVYKSNKQALSHYVSLEKNKVKEAKKDIENNIGYEEFMTKYPKAVSNEKLLLIKSSYVDYNDKNVTYFYTLELGERDRYQIEFDDNSDSIGQTGKWIFSYHKKTSYSEESIDAFYLVEDFKSQPLPAKYSKLIQYSDCLIDTTATVFKTSAKDSGVRYYSDAPNKARSFNTYVEEVLKRPYFDHEKFNVLIGFDTLRFDKPDRKISKKQREESNKKRAVYEKEYEKFREQLEAWEEKRLAKIDSLKNNDPNFMPKLLEAYNEVSSSGASDDQFEEYVGLYVSKEAELELKRNRRVIGGCSMDNSPRIHAQNIALLSAETTKWEIFLQSHLNIMNDRFDRVSDGSWAQQGRSTYIRELEDLDINVLDLLFGISLRIENPANNHYYGSINRLGRALSESKFSAEFENRALAMIEDNELDVYNRLLMYFLFDNYNYHLPNEYQQKRNKEKLRASIAKLPDYVASRIEVK